MLLQFLAEKRPVPEVATIALKRLHGDEEDEIEDVGKALESAAHQDAGDDDGVEG